MVVRPMLLRPLSQCDRSLNFHPHREWPGALPALAWKGILLTGFDRSVGDALDLFENSRCTWLEAFTACYPELGLAELSRLYSLLSCAHPSLAQEFQTMLFQAYALRWCDRLTQTVEVIVRTPPEFQALIDDKKWSARDLAPLLAVTDVTTVAPLLSALSELSLSKNQAVQALELVVELFMMGQPLRDLLPSSDDGDAYLRRLVSWRKPASSLRDEEWRETVGRWPWPAQVQGAWQRFGDQAGLEIKIRTTSPQDFDKKLERLLSIRDTWSCNS